MPAQGQYAVAFQQIPSDMVPQSVRLGLGTQRQYAPDKVCLARCEGFGQGSGAAAVEHAAVGIHPRVHPGGILHQQKMQGIGGLLRTVPVQLVQGAQVGKNPGNLPGDFRLPAGEKLGHAGGGAVGLLQQLIQGGKQGGKAAFPQPGQQGMGRAQGKLPRLQMGHGAAHARQTAGQAAAKTGLPQVKGKVFQYVGQMPGEGQAQAEGQGQPLRQGQRRALLPGGQG